MIHQTDGTTSLHFWYGEHGAEAFTYISGNTNETYYYVKDALGNVIGIYDDTGDMLVRYDYDAWGRLRTSWFKNDEYQYSVLGNTNPIRYKGYYFDKDTGFYYLQSRYYDPVTGRFLNADDVSYIGVSGTVLGFNLMSYCEGNPIMWQDARGLFSIPSWTLSIAIDAIILYASSWLHATWMGFMAPIKFMAKNAAAVFFSRYIAPCVRGIANQLISCIVKVIIWIGKKALAATFNISAKLAISAILSEPLRIVSACTSVGGLIAALVDYITDKRFDGWIKIW